MAQEEFKKAGYTVVETDDNENKLLSFLKENYPSVIRDNEINLEELKAVLGLPIDEKVNGYGLNFVGRNFAKAKYAQKTEKELQLNRSLSVAEMTTQNLVLKGDNLESLKILKSHYSGKIKCIYIDPPYNTEKEVFLYPDKFDKEEAEVLGLVNLNESEFARMDFSFKNPKSHNGWLAFMYPRLLLSRDLLSKDGLIFISIDDNEQANLKLLCDDIFGEENFICQLIWNKQHSQQQGLFKKYHEYVLLYAKNEGVHSNISGGEGIIDAGALKKVSKGNPESTFNFPAGVRFEAPEGTEITGTFGDAEKVTVVEGVLKCVDGKTSESVTLSAGWTQKDQMTKYFKGEDVFDTKNQKVIEFYFNSKGKLKCKKERSKITPSTMLPEYGMVSSNTALVTNLFEGVEVFDSPKPINMISDFASWFCNDEEIILDFFAGSGTTGHAIMELNKDGGNRKFILCQKDEPIDSINKKKAYDFCLENNLPPVISSITIERLKRAGEKIAKEIEEENKKVGLFEEDKKQVPDIGFKVFDSIEATKLKVDETTGQISILKNNLDALSRIYNMIFTVGLDEPTQVPEEVVKDCIYKIGNHYYITNSEKINSDDYSNAIKNGKVFIDGWTASLNGTLQNYKEDVKIVF
jgi:adenine-specific DNA-methyltransferase